MYVTEYVIDMWHLVVKITDYVNNANAKTNSHNITRSVTWVVARLVTYEWISDLSGQNEIIQAAVGESKLLVNIRNIVQFIEVFYQTPIELDEIVF